MRKVWIIQKNDYDTWPEAVATTEELARRVAEAIGSDVDSGPLTLFEEGDEPPPPVLRYSLRMLTDGSIDEELSGFHNYANVDGCPPPSPEVRYRKAYGDIWAEDYPSREEAETAARAVLEQIGSSSR